ncbi:hypothetical protein, partial [Streptomyces sp. BF23-30]|uniref:hypothetical protein n=1 Tax=Streptomyces sp. BF23-30 TaxID=3240281 RepID=UPI0034E45304
CLALAGVLFIAQSYLAALLMPVSSADLARLRRSSAPRPDVRPSRVTLVSQNINSRKLFTGPRHARGSDRLEFAPNTAEFLSGIATTPLAQTS